MFEPSAPCFDAWVWADLHSSNVEWPREIGHSTIIRNELFPGSRGRFKILLNLRIDSLHKLDHGRPKHQEV